MLKWTGFPLTEFREVRSNPYCGFYTIYMFYAHDDRIFRQNCLLGELELDQTQSLCLVEINLVYYRDKSLAEEALKRIERIFSWFAKQKKEMIVRFLYDWEGKGLLYEPQELSIILQHMKQLEPLLREFTKQIYILQGLFIGSWGEMHSSRYLDERSLIALAHQLHACSGGDSFIALRCPSIWRTIFRTYEPLTAAHAYSKSMPARFGLFNDGLLASETDNGTYGSITKSLALAYSDKLTRKEELIFQDKLCRFVPNGGETVGYSYYHRFRVARRDFASMHISYLNANYDPVVLNKWKKTKTGLWDPFWWGKSIYDYMASHLGYRFVVEGLRLSNEKNNGRTMQVNINLVNKGFASSHKRFVVELLLLTATLVPLASFPAQTDTRFWQPGSPISLTWDIDWDSWEDGLYVLGLKLSDPASGKVIQLANTYPMDHSDLLALGHLQLSRRGEP